MTTRPSPPGRPVRSTGRSRAGLTSPIGVRSARCRTSRQVDIRPRSGPDAVVGFPRGTRDQPPGIVGGPAPMSPSSRSEASSSGRMAAPGASSQSLRSPRSRPAPGRPGTAGRTARIPGRELRAAGRARGPAPNQSPAGAAAPACRFGAGREPDGASREAMSAFGLHGRNTAEKRFYRGVDGEPYVGYVAVTSCKEAAERCNR